MRWVVVLSLSFVCSCSCSDGGAGATDARPDGPGGDGGGPAVCGNGATEPPEECDDSNLEPDDGCEPDCTIGPVIMQCRTLAPIASGTCEVTSGSAAKLLEGTVLVPGTVYRGGQVAIDAAGTITCVGCDCEASAAGATRITCPTGVISPGLINPHDHITFTHNDPYTDTGERYEHRHDWRRGLRGHTEINSTGGATAAQIRWGELRFLMGGATSTVGSGSATGFLRNLDRADQEGLGQPQVQFETFPLGDTSGTQLSSGCGYPSIDTTAAIAAYDAYLPHIAEGIDDVSRNEFLCTSSSMNGGQDLVQEQSGFIHSIALRADDYALMARDGTALIWSPRSNVTLYGETAMVTAAARLGVLIALGTDWMPTGSMNLLRELRCASSLNDGYYDSFFSAEDLWKMVTINAAQAGAVDDAIGVLAAGRVADVAIFDGAAGVDHRAVIDAEPQGVVLVLRGGEALYGDATVVAAMPGIGACDLIDVCGREKRLCAMDDIGMTYDGLQTAAGAIYPAFFCGEPTNEPSCVPTRPTSVNGSTVYTGAAAAGDGDGDGIEDGVDFCPTVFNPVRPVDNGIQADFDGDGSGDACDVCPLNAATVVCTGPDPEDADGDGVPSPGDNCPSVANPDQADGDSDGAGDACDGCPGVTNPACFTIPAIRNPAATGHPQPGTRVEITGAVVTAVKSSTPKGRHVWIQDPAAAQYGGLTVYFGSATLPTGIAVGNTVDVAGTYEEYFGLSEITSPTVTITGSTTPIAATAVDPALIATGGAQAEALESMLVTVTGVMVTNPNPDGPTNDYDELQVTGGLRVDDLIIDGCDPGSTATGCTGVLKTWGTFSGAYDITGILMYSFSNTKLTPRDKTNDFDPDAP